MKGYFKWHLLQIFLAVALDFVIGDPQSKYFPHPVRWIGNFISLVERYVYPRNSGYLGGTLLVAVVLGVSLGIALGVIWLAGFINHFLSFLIGSLFIFYSISFSALRKSALSVERWLERQDLERARIEVGEIVGRDTGVLDSEGLVRAAVETVAENASDGVVAPLFYALVGGPLLAVLYRTVNTLDSMVGYRSERYLRFGWTSARLDDLLNLLPARLTALFLVLSGVWRRKNPLSIAKIIFRDAPKHKSPNAGWPEAAMAGLLNVQLGGINYYRGKPSFCAYLGDSGEPLDPSKIGESVVYLSFSYLLFLCVLIFMLGWSCL